MAKKTKKQIRRKNQKTKSKRRKIKKISPKRLLKYMLGAAGIALLVYCGYLLFNPLQLKSENITIQYNQPYNPQSNIRFVFLGSKKNVKITGDLDTSKIGDYVITYKYKDEKINVNVKVADIVPPVLLLKSYETDMVEEIKPEKLVESVEDDSKVTIAFEDNTNINKEGKQTVTVIATDEYGNQSSGKVSVTRNKDTKAPVIENLADTIEIWQGNDVIGDPHIQISDNLDKKPKIEIDTSKIDNTKVGEYEIVYTVTDRSGNSAKKSQNVKVIANDEFNKKIVYLTFDGGPSSITPQILKILEEEKVPATFFVNGVDKDSAKWIRAMKELGHSVGLNSYIYDASVYKDSETFWQDIDKTAQLVKEQTGEDTTLLRFLGGSGNTLSKDYAYDIMTTLTREALDKGYQYYDWNVDVGDTEGDNVASEKIAENALNHDEETMYITIVLHDEEGKQTTVDALKQIIQEYKEQGFTFMPITEKSQYVHQDLNN